MSGIETKSPLSHLIFTFSLGDCNPHFRNATEDCLIQGHSVKKSWNSNPVLSPKPVLLITLYWLVYTHSILS